MCLPEYESQNLKHTLMLWVVFFCEFFHFVGKKKGGPTTWSNALLKKIQKFHQISRKISMKLSKKTLWLPKCLGYQRTYIFVCIYIYFQELCYSLADCFLGWNPSVASETPIITEQIPIITHPDSCPRWWTPWLWESYGIAKAAFMTSHNPWCKEMRPWSGDEKTCLSKV
jgi:hypothetical protein